MNYLRTTAGAGGECTPPSNLLPRFCSEDHDGYVAFVPQRVYLYKVYGAQVKVYNAALYSIEE